MTARTGGPCCSRAWPPATHRGSRFRGCRNCEQQWWQAWGWHKRTCVMGMAELVLGLPNQPGPRGSGHRQRGGKGTADPELGWEGGRPTCSQDSVIRAHSPPSTGNPAGPCGVGAWHQRGQSRCRRGCRPTGGWGREGTTVRTRDRGFVSKKTMDTLGRTATAVTVVPEE